MLCIRMYTPAERPRALSYREAQAAIQRNQSAFSFQLSPICQTTTTFDGSTRVHRCYKLSFLKGSYIIKDVCTKEGEGVGPMRTDADTGEGSEARQCGNNYFLIQK